jgi:transposase-like protein
LLRAFLAQRARLCAAQEPAFAKAGLDDDCLREPRWFNDRRDLAEVRRDIAARLAKWQPKYPRLCNWVEDNIEER